MRPDIQITLSTAVAALGLGLVAMMVTTEGEPGALPLALLLSGAVGYVTGRIRRRDSGQR